jgi:hypothetical protein
MARNVGREIMRCEQYWAAGEPQVMATSYYKDEFLLKLGALSSALLHSRLSFFCPVLTHSAFCKLRAKDRAVGHVETSQPLTFFSFGPMLPSPLLAVKDEVVQPFDRAREPFNCCRPLRG